MPELSIVEKELYQRRWDDLEVDLMAAWTTFSTKVSAVLKEVYTEANRFSYYNSNPAYRVQRATKKALVECLKDEGVKISIEESVKAWIIERLEMAEVTASTITTKCERLKEEI